MRIISSMSSRHGLHAIAITMTIILAVSGIQLVSILSNLQNALGSSCNFELTRPKLISSEDGRSMASVSLGEQFIISATIVNQCTNDQPFAVIVEMRNSDGITEYLGWQSGVIESPVRTAEISIPWTPEHVGIYELRAFAVNSFFETPQILSSLRKASVTVAEPDRDFSIVLIPDTQKYWPSGNENIAFNQTRWMVLEKNTQNIQLAIHLGDIVNVHENDKQWEKASDMMKILDGKVPYMILPGNHDVYDENGNPIWVNGVPTDEVKDYLLFKKFFPSTRFVTENGGEITPDGANTWMNFDVGLNKFTVVAMEYCPTEKNLKEVSAFIKDHSDRRVILATHAFLRSDGTWTSVTGGGVCTKVKGTDHYSTKTIWDLVVYPNPNVFLVVSGHSNGENKRIDYNVAGEPVQQIVIDYQYKKTGGDGMLKIIRFDPEQDKINFETYSPWLDLYPSGAKSKFTIDYDMS